MLVPTRKILFNGQQIINKTKTTDRKYVANVKLAVSLCKKWYYAQERQYGGVLLATVGRQIGTVDCQGTGDQGRCALVTLRGQHNEGVQVISAYRVCQKGATAGPHTAYVYQIHDMIKKRRYNLGFKKNIWRHGNFDTWKEDKRYGPIVMMDLNDD